MYGISQAAKLNQAGEFEAAIAAASTVIAAEPREPEPLVDRAFALAQLERWAEAVSDLERALDLDEQAGILDGGMVDDQYFSALLGLARSERDPEQGVARLQRYRERLSDGAHAADVELWTRRLRGEVRREVVKERLE